MLIPLIFDDARLRGQPGAVAVGAGGEGDDPLHERADVRLHRVDVLGQHRLLDLRDQPFVGQVDAVDLDLRRVLVEQVVLLALVVLADRLVRVEEPAAAEDAAVPALHAVAGDRQRALVERLAVVVERRQVEVGDRPTPSQRGHMPPRRLKVATFVWVLPPRSTVMPPLRPDRRDVERVGVGRADVRPAEAAEQDAQHRVGVGDRADRGARVGAEALLVDDDRGRQPLQHVDVGPRQRRHEALHEGAVGLVDHPLRLGGDRGEHERALARAGDAGEHRQPALRDLDADVLEVVHARAVHADQVVAVGSVRRRRLRVRPGGHARRPFYRIGGGGEPGAHRSSSRPRTLPSGSVTVATRRPPPTSCAGSFSVAPAAVTSASFASMSGTCQ